MIENRFTDEDMNYLVQILHQQFLQYYKNCHDEMSLSERLFFEDIQKFVEGGFEFKISGGFNG